jgi:hypothetical protein
LEYASIKPKELYTNNPRIILSNEFIVNKNSNPLIISSLISNQTDFIHNMFDGEVDHYIFI